MKELAADGTPVAVTCRVLKIARAPYYRWLKLMLNTANLRVHASWDTETTSTVVALRTLARRAHAMLKRGTWAAEDSRSHHRQLAP